MCGIFGYSGKNPVDPLRLSWLAAENQARGEDSAGVATPSGIYKDAVPTKELILRREYRDLIEGEHTIIGHARKATMGAKIAKNAHPFAIFETPKHTDAHLVGTHNGQVFDYYIEKICKELELEKPDVDSELIFQVISKMKFDYNEALSKIEGAMALAFIRPVEFPDVLYLYRRQSRPLHVGFIGPDMYYSSEADPLYLIGCGAIESLDTDKLYIFRKGGLVEVSPVKKCLITTIKEDQGITTWLQTATEKEKAVVGIFGAPVERGRSVITQPRQLPLYTAKDGEDGTNLDPVGGWRNRFPVVGGRSNVGGPAILLPDLEGIRTKIVFESLQSPGRGKFINGGDMYAAYIICKLHTSHDPNIVLPAWLVRVQGHGEIVCITSYNGLAVLEIPEKKVSQAGVTLQIINPVYPEVIYTVPVYGAQGGRVLEVTLSIPFPAQEETHQTGEIDLPEGHTNTRNTTRSTEPLNGILSFPNRMATIQKYLDDYDRIQEKAQEVLHDGPSTGIYNNDVSDVAGQNRVSAEGTESDKKPDLLTYVTVKGKIITPLFDLQTDALPDMDIYTTGINVDESDELLRNIDKSLTEIGNEDDMRHTLSRVRSYLVYLNDYFSNRSRTMSAIHEDVDDSEPMGR